MGKNLILLDDKQTVPDNEVLTGDNQLESVDWLEKIIDRQQNQKIHLIPVLDDVIVQCPKCRTLETLQFAGEIMSPSSKFSQKNGLVYHDCGSVSPCRLFGRTQLSEKLTNNRRSLVV